MTYNRLFLAGCVTLSSFLCLSLPVAADSQSKDKAFIQSAIQKMDKAAHNKDAEGYVAFTHPDFVNIDKTGKETMHGKEERREKLSQGFAQATQVTQTTTITHIIFSTQGATVDKASHSFITLTRNGQKVEIKGGGTYRDFWVKSAGLWRQKKSRAITEALTINGQPIP